uniref:Uncharacterized protein n=1 Tax=Anguilla anguilla TaxID=7936 RepID=A0A0E9TTG7_ANGAN
MAVIHSKCIRQFYVQNKWLLTGGYLLPLPLQSLQTRVDSLSRCRNRHFS